MREVIRHRPLVTMLADTIVFASSVVKKVSDQTKQVPNPQFDRKVFFIHPRQTEVSIYLHV